MLNKHKTSIKQILVYLILLSVFLILVPFSATRLFSNPMEEPEPKTAADKIPKTVDIYIAEKKAFKTIDFDHYIEGVVASEMPSDFHFEALKAQAVASRTYALGRILSGTTLCDTVHCQAYRSYNIPSKTKKAVQATRGQILYYNGNLASQTLYFSSSAGNTENAEDVFSNPYPYLVSVPSSNEPGATHKKEQVTLTLSDFAKKVKKSLPELDFKSIKKSSIKILSHTEGGRVAEVTVGGQVLSGADIRRIFNLYSTRFSFQFKGKSIIITSRGSGHGVGMSQYGANGLAKEGKSYQEILSHYYRGTQVFKSK